MNNISLYVNFHIIHQHLALFNQNSNNLFDIEAFNE